MRRFSTTWQNWMVGAVLASASGCGSNTEAMVEPPAEEQGLREVGELHKLYAQENHKPATKVANFDRYSPGFTFGSLGLQTGDLVSYYGSGLSDGPEAATTVLAYEKATPKQGGTVLMQDGTTLKKLTAAEFAAAPKAGD